MRLTILFLFIVSVCSGQLISNNLLLDDQVSPREAGLIFDEQFTSLSGWTVVGSGTFTATPTGMDMSGGSSAGATYIKKDNFFWGSNKWRMVTRTKVTALGTTSGGIGIGLEATTSLKTRRGFWYRLDTSTGSATAGQLVPLRHIDASFANFRNQALQVVPVVNDVIELVLERYNDYYIVSYQNITQGSEPQVVATYAGTYILGLNNTAQVIVTSYGGGSTFEDTTIQFYSDSYINTKVMFVGNSITTGLGSTDYIYKAYPDIVMNSTLDYFEKWGGCDDITQDVLSSMTNILLISPRYVFLMHGGNDVYYGVADATMKANYTSIRNQLVAAGITVVHLANTPRDATDLTALNTWISGEATTWGDQFIDTFTPLASGTQLDAAYDSGDGTHPNDAGYSLIASTIESAVSFISTSPYSDPVTMAIRATRVTHVYWSALETFIDGLVSDGDYNNISEILIYGLQSEKKAVRGLIGRKKAVLAGATFIDKQGLSSNGTSSFFYTGMVPSQDLITGNSIYISNSAFYGFYCFDNRSASTQTAVGFIGTSNHRVQMIQESATALSFGINGTGFQQWTGDTEYNDLTWYFAERTASNVGRLLENSTQRQTTAQGAVALTNIHDVTGSALNTSGAKSLYSDMTIGAMVWGSPTGFSYSNFITRFNQFVTDTSGL